MSLVTTWKLVRAGAASEGPSATRSRRPLKLGSPFTLPTLISKRVLSALPAATLADTSDGTIETPAEAELRRLTVRPRGPLRANSNCSSAVIALVVRRERDRVPNRLVGGRTSSGLTVYRQIPLSGK